ncbi:MAG: hypothetical protein LW595_06085 [Rickettsiales bacterium]|nr:hypothetical protein [Rickettsiales bacterium]
MSKLKESYIAVFAHFDKDNLIDDYVVEYLEELKKVAEKIIFVSDCNIAESEYLKINDLCDKIIAKRHEEYDFGSYKRGINELSNIINDYDHLIIANDSCYLFRSLIPVFQEMESRDGIDFWGLSQNSEVYAEHIQSYFMVFNKKIFCNQDFLNFFADVKKLDSKESIIKDYEIGLTVKLLELGFKKSSFIDKIFKSNPMDYYVFFNEIINTNFPLIKVDMMKKIVFCKNYFDNLSKFIPLFLLKKIINNSNIFNYAILYYSYLSDNDLKKINRHISRICFGKININVDFLNVKFKSILRIFIKNNKLIIKIFGIPIFKKNNIVNQ